MDVSQSEESSVEEDSFDIDYESLLMNEGKESSSLIACQTEL